MFEHVSVEIRSDQVATLLISFFPMTFLISRIRIISRFSYIFTYLSLGLSFQVVSLLCHPGDHPLPNGFLLRGPDFGGLPLQARGQRHHESWQSAENHLKTNGSILWMLLPVKTMDKAINYIITYLQYMILQVKKLSNQIQRKELIIWLAVLNGFNQFSVCFPSYYSLRF